ncbi:MAG: hypothetical protein ACHQUC_06130 [Chlamydiales bacterium]
MNQLLLASYTSASHSHKNHQLSIILSATQISRGILPLPIVASACLGIPLALITLNCSSYYQSIAAHNEVGSMALGSMEVLGSNVVLVDSMDRCSMRYRCSNHSLSKKLQKQTSS